MARPKKVLISLRELRRFRVKTAEGQPCGRITDVYFDDLSWRVQHLVLSIEPSQFGRKQVLLNPRQVESFSSSEAAAHLKVPVDALQELPSASSVRPVCKQYAAFAVSSPGAGCGFKASPHLRSSSAVMTYRVDGAGDFSGAVADLLVDDEGWGIRFVALEHAFEKKKLNFHILPQSIERFIWATQRIVLRELKPVAVSLGENAMPSEGERSGAAA